MYISLKLNSFKLSIEDFGGQGRGSREKEDGKKCKCAWKLVEVLQSGDITILF